MSIQIQLYAHTHTCVYIYMCVYIYIHNAISCMPCHMPCNYIAVQYLALFNLHLHFLCVALRYIVLPLEHTHVTITCVYQSGDALTTCVSDAITTCVSVCVPSEQV